MPKFEKQYVHFMWSDELEGKMVFFADYIQQLKQRVENNIIGHYAKVTKSEVNLPFRIADGQASWQFAYYDPYYELRIAREQGKVVQRYWHSSQEWEEHIGDDFTDDVSLYRIKPEGPAQKPESEEKPITNRELAQWLAEGYGQYMDAEYITSQTSRAYYCYDTSADDQPIDKHIRVRLWGDTEWRIPTRKYMYIHAEDEEGQE